ncbi:MAG: hypothetical protein ABUT20_49995 [Bacteroidota bacterium]
MLRIGMIGEYPTDVDCISSLLMKKYEGSIAFFPLIYDLHGSMLENPKIKRQLRKEYEIVRPDFVLFIRDLDGLENNKFLLDQRRAYFTEFNSVVDKKGIFLLNIYELEALLLCDVNLLNTHFEAKLEPIEDGMMIPDPKGYLKERVKKYSTGDNTTLFSKLDFEHVVNNCLYFKKFDEDFEKRLVN